jgi:hypothetical protein
MKTATKSKNPKAILKNLAEKHEETLKSLHNDPKEMKKVIAEMAKRSKEDPELGNNSMNCMLGLAMLTVGIALEEPSLAFVGSLSSLVLALGLIMGAAASEVTQQSTDTSEKCIKASTYF